MVDPGTLAYELVIGCTIGFTIGLTGVGGGVLAMPALTVLLGLPATAAVGTASAYASMTNGIASLAHWRQRTIQYRVALWFLAGAIPGNVAACLVIGRLKRTATEAQALLHLQANLKAFVAGVMLFSVLLMVANLMRERSAGGQGAVDLKTPPPLQTSHRRGALGIVLGALVGAIIGATSIGGGVIIIPLLVVCFGLGMRLTIGTSTLIALVLTLSTALLSSGRGDVDWLVAGIMAIGSLGGVNLGSRLGRRLSDGLLQGAVIAFLLVAIAAMLLT